MRGEGAGEEGQSLRPLLPPIAAVALGTFIIFLTINTGPVSLHLEDRDGDGISDLYQDIEVRSELVLTDSGDWKEVHLGYGSEPNVPFISFVGILLLIVFPTTIYIHFSRKKDNALREGLWGEAAMNDAVRRMCAFLEINPSLIKALKDSYVSLPEQDRYVLSKLIWEIRGSVLPFEEIFSRYREEWSLRSRPIGKALLSLEGVLSESDLSEVRATSRRTVAELSRDGRASMAEYIRSLAVPTSALFALGVLLPVLLATMIPLAGIGGRTAWMIAFLLWVVVPVGIVATGAVLVNRRPKFRSRSNVQWVLRPRLDLLSVVGVVMGGTLILASILSIAGGPMGVVGLTWGTTTGYILLLWGLSLTIAGTVRWISLGYREEELALVRENDMLPELMRSLGRSVQEGLSYERALDRAFRELAPEFRGSSLPQKEIFQGANSEKGGIMMAQVRAVREFSRAGSKAGGKAINALASHLSDLRSLEEEMEQRIRSTIGQIELTASLLAPVMIGASIGIFELLESTNVPEGSSGAVGMMWAGSPAGGGLSSSSFLIISGIYLLLLSISTSLILHRLSKGVPKGGWHRVPSRMIISITSFTLGVLGSTSLIG